MRRKSTIRRMPPLTRKLTRAMNEIELHARAIAKLVEEIATYERFYRAGVKSASVYQAAEEAGVGLQAELLPDDYPDSEPGEGYPGVGEGATSVVAEDANGQRGPIGPAQEGGRNSLDG